MNIGSVKYLIVLLIISTFVAPAQNIKFTKANFPGKSKELKIARKNLKKGYKYFDLGKGLYPVALEYLLKAEDFNPNNTDLNFMIGICYLNSVLKTNAIRYFEKTSSLDSNVYPDTKYYLAQAYQLNYEFDKAIKLYKEFKMSLPLLDSAYNLAVMVPQIEKKIKECYNGKKLVQFPAKVKIDNLGPALNTIYPEYAPLISADESELFFTSRRKNTTGGKLDHNTFQYYEDIYISRKSASGWSNAINPPKPLNSKENDATVGLGTDGQTLLIYKGSHGGDIYQCKRIGDKWSKPKKLNKNINTRYHESSGSISYDGKRLFFVSDKPGGYGGRDIYVSEKDENGDWGRAKNLGQVINTPYDEEGVFIHPNGKTLYFSSKGHNSMGGYDIFKAKYENSRWNDPVNIGYPINTTDDDVFFSIAASGVHGYYSSVKSDGFGDQDLYCISFSGYDKPVENNLQERLLANMTEPVIDTLIEKPVQVEGTKEEKLKGNPIVKIKDNKPVVPQGNKVISTIPPVKEELAVNPKKEDKLPPKVDTNKIIHAEIIEPVKEKIISQVKMDTLKKSVPEKIVLIKPVETDTSKISKVVVVEPPKSNINKLQDSIINQTPKKDLTIRTPKPEVKKPKEIKKEQPQDKKEQPVAKTNVNIPKKPKESHPVILKGIVSDETTNTPLNAVFEISDKSKKGIVTTYNSDSLSGMYVISLESEKNYGITVRCSGYYMHYEILSIPSATAGDLEKNIRLKKMVLISPQKYNLIYFDFNKSTARQESNPDMDRVLKYMNDIPTAKIKIAGHTDNAGSAQYNKILSSKRAKYVANYLTDKGISPNRMISFGYGFNKPIASNKTIDGRQINRRVEIINMIFFDISKSDLRPESVTELDYLTRYLTEDPSAHVEITGHTDNTGTPQFNKKLSVKRAKSVCDYLTNKGINENRMKYKGFGITQPVSTNKTSEGRQLNRRAEFQIISK